MYMFLALLVVAILGVPIVVYLENKRRKKLEEEKASGIWDFIDEEYLPYLGSHTDPITQSDQLAFLVEYFDTWTLVGKLHFNAAGVYAAFDDAPFPNAPKTLFIWGKDQPSRFCPKSPLFYHSAEWKGNGQFILKLKTKENQSIPGYTLTIKNAESSFVDNLKKALCD